MERFLNFEFYLPILINIMVKRKIKECRKLRVQSMYIGRDTLLPALTKKGFQVRNELFVFFDCFDEFTIFKKKK